MRFLNRRDAEDAIQGAEGQDFQGRELRVQFAKQRRPDNPREFYAGRDGGRDGGRFDDRDRGYDDRDRGYDDRRGGGRRDRYDDRDRYDRRRSRSPDRRDRSRSPRRSRSRSPRRRSASPRRD